MVGGATATSYAPRAQGRVGDVEAIRGRPDRKQEGRAASREGKDEQWAQEGVVRSRQTGVHPAPHYLSLRPFPGPPCSLVQPHFCRQRNPAGAPAPNHLVGTSTPAPTPTPL